MDYQRCVAVFRDQLGSQVREILTHKPDLLGVLQVESVEEYLPPEEAFERENYAPITHRDFFQAVENVASESQIVLLQPMYAVARGGLRAMAIWPVVTPLVIGMPWGQPALIALNSYDTRYPLTLEVGWLQVHAWYSFETVGQRRHFRTIEGQLQNEVRGLFEGVERTLQAAVHWWRAAGRERIPEAEAALQVIKWVEERVLPVTKIMQVWHDRHGSTLADLVGAVGRARAGFDAFQWVERSKRLFWAHGIRREL